MFKYFHWNIITYNVLFLAGFRHPSPTTVARTIRILHMLLALVGKHLNCDKFEVNTQSVAYLAGKKVSVYLFFILCPILPQSILSSSVNPSFLVVFFLHVPVHVFSSPPGVRGSAKPLQSETQEVVTV